MMGLKRALEELLKHGNDDAADAIAQPRLS
jgi:hypothetical protein